jgi:predicted esterase
VEKNGKRLSRRELLRLSGVWIAGLLLPAASCRESREQEPYGGTMVFRERGSGASQRAVEVEIETPRGGIEGVLYPAEGSPAAILMVGGAGGGIHGPSGTYDPLARRMQGDGARALRLDYRVSNDLEECIFDVLAAVEALEAAGVERVVLLGWSFGGAVVISAGARSEAVVGVATVASQTYGTEEVEDLSPEKSLLLIHGTEDDVLPHRLSEYLYNRAGEPKELVLYTGSGHGIERHHEEMLEKLHEWTRDLLASPKRKGSH